jgi:phosphoribosylformylglycinamidine synthase
VALAECAIAGGTGFAASIQGDHPWHVGLFSESASRAVVSVAPERAAALEDVASEHDVPWSRLGETGGPRIVFDGLLDVTVGEVTAAYEDAIPKLLAG